MDAEKAEAQRRKDVEKAEAQRKKDQADAREQSRKLIINIEELEYKIKRLEQQATDRELERKQKDEATQRYIESLAGDIEATADFLAVGDEAGLDRIKPKPCLPHTSGWSTTIPTPPLCASGKLSALLSLPRSDNSAAAPL